GFELATAHLLDIGHRRVAFLNGQTVGGYLQGRPNFFAQARLGFERAFRRARLAPDPHLYVESAPPDHGGPEPPSKPSD
ncbi:MAG TPA: hypothetical protein P5137_04615, partial [Candidatus Brocadiia bacterium]|nr:hypothetical protein [Candidatus Brocadiia bacterium]